MYERTFSVRISVILILVHPRGDYKWLAKDNGSLYGHGSWIGRRLN